MSQHKRVLLVDSSGNPILTGPIQLDSTNKLAVSLYGKSTEAGDSPITVVALNNEGQNSATAQNVKAHMHARGDGVFEMWRNNEEITLLASAARTAQTDSAAQVNHNHRGMILFVDVTVDAAAGAITPNIAVKDPVSGTAKVIWTAAAAIAATGQFVYMLLPGAADAGSYTEQKELAIPRDWFFRMTVADADSLTYSVSCCML